MKLQNHRRPMLFAAFFLSSAFLVGATFQWSAEAATAPAPARPAVAAPVATQPAGPPQPRIIVIDRATIMRLSSAGKAMMASAQNLSRQADTEFKTQAEGLQKEGIALQQQMAIMAPEARTAKQTEFNNKQDAFQKRVTDRQTQIQNGFAVAGQKLDTALGPILQTIMRERGANLLLDRSAVILATIDVDVTATAIERLDRALPTLSVTLARAAPAAAAPPAATPR